MAFIGILMIFAAAASAVFIVGVLPIIIGTVLIHKTEHKKAGTVLRCLGYILLIPSIIIGLILAIIISGEIQ